MKTFLMKCILAGVVLWGLVAASVAGTVTTAGSGNWNSTTANAPWPGGVVPASTDDVVIRAGDSITVTEAATIHSITFNNISATAATLTVNESVTLTVTAGITLQNSATLNTAATIQGLGTINCASVTVGGTTAASSTTARTTTLTSTIAALSMSGNLAVTSRRDYVSLSYRYNNATFALGSGSVTVQTTVALTAPTSGTATMTLATGSQNGTLTLSGSTPFSTSGGGTYTFTANGTDATVIYSGAAQTVQPVTYNNLTLSGSSTKTLTSVSTVNGDLTLGGTASATLAATFAVGGDVAIGSGATLDVSASNYGLSVGGNWSNDGTFNGRSGTVTFNGTGAQAIGGTVATAFYSVTVNKTSGTAALSASVSVAGNLSVSAGTFDLSTLTADRASAGGTLTVSNGATLLVGGASNFPANYSTVTLGATSTVHYNRSDDQSVSARTYGNLVTSGSGTKTLAGAVVVSGGLTIGSGTSLDVSASNYALSVAGDWTNNGGTFVPRSGTVTFNGTGAQAINGTAESQTFNDVTLSKTAGTTLSVGGSTTSLTVNNLTQTTGNFTAPATLDVNGNVTLTAGTFTAGANLTVAGGWSKASGATFTPGTGTVTFDGSGAQTISGTSASQAFNNVEVAKTAGTLLNTGGSTTNLTVKNFTQTTGDFTAPTILTVSNSVLLSAGTFTAGTAINVAGDWTNNGGTFVPGSGTVTFNGSGAQAINGTAASQTFYHLTMNKTAGTLTAPATLDINGNVTLTAGTFTAGASLTVAGNWSNNGGTFTPGTGTVTFDGSGAQAINGTAASQTFNDMVMAKTAGTTLSVSGSTTSLTMNNLTQTTGNFTAPATLTVSDSVLLSAGTFTAGTTINVAGDWTNNGGTFVPGSNTVTFNGSVAQAINGTAASQTFYHLTMNKTAGTLTAPAMLDVNGNVTLTAGTFTAGASLAVAGNWSNNGGTFTPGSGTVTFDGTGAQAINGTAASQTFNDMVMAKTAGTTLSVSGSTTSLTVNNLTQTTGNFTAPATLTVSGSVLLSAGTFTAGTTINVAGDWTNNGATFTGGSSTVTFNGSGAQAINGTSASQIFYHLSISSSDTTTLGRNIGVSGNLSVSAGTLDLGAYTANRSTSGGTLTVANGATLKIGGGNTLPANYTTKTFGVSSTVEYNGTSQSVSGETYGHLTTSGSGTKTLAGNTTVNGVLTVGLGTVLDASTRTLILAGSGTPLVVNGTFTPSSSMVSYTSGSGATVTAVDYNHLTINGAGGTFTPAANLPVAGDLTVSAGTLDLGAYTANRSTSGGTLTVANGATLKIGGGNTLPANYTTKTFGVSSTVEYNGTSQSVSGETYGHLTTSGSGTKTLAGNTTVNGVLTVELGTDLDASTRTLILAGSGTPLIVNGTFTPSSSTVSYTSGSGATVTAVDYNHLTVNGAGGTFTPADNLPVAGDLTVSAGILDLGAHTADRTTSGGTLMVANGATLKIGGTNTLPANYTAHAIGASGTIEYNGANQVVAVLNSAQNYGNLTLSGPGSTKTLAGSIGVAGALTVNSGVFTIAGATVNIIGSLTINASAAVTVGEAGVLSNAGTVTSLASTLTIGSGGVYQHNRNGGAVALATWDNGSTCEILGITSTGPTSGLNQAFHHFTWNCPGQTINFDLVRNLATINGDFTMVASGSGSVIANSASYTAFTMNILGNMLVQGGTFNFASAAYSGYAQILNLGGSYNQSGGTFRNSTANAGDLTVNFTGAGKTFTRSGGTLNNANMDFVIANAASLTLNDDLAVASGETCTVNNGGTLNCGTDAITGAGTFTCSAGATLGIGSPDGITSSGLAGNIQTTSRSYATTANYTYNGTEAQVTGNGLPATVNNLTVNNTAGVTLTGSPTINGVLTLTSGKLSTGANIPVIAAGASIAGAGSNTYVVGTLQKTFATGNGQSFAFPIGDASTYAPIGVTSLNVGTAGGLTAGTTGIEHPDITASGLDASASINRYWTLAAGGAFAASAYDATFNFVADDEDPGVATDEVVVRRYSGGTWSATATGARTDTSTQATSLNALGEFAIGEQQIHHYVVAASSPQTAGAAFPTTVTAQDILNQTVVADDDTMVTMTGTGGVVFDSNNDGTFDDDEKVLSNGFFSINTKDNVAENVTITATDENLKTGQVAVTILSSSASVVRVETAANGSGNVVPAQNIPSGGSVTGYAVTRDAFGNFVANAAADNWSLENITGAMASEDLVPAPDGKSAVLTGQEGGSATIRATSGELAVVESGTVTVFPLTTVTGSAPFDNIETSDSTPSFEFVANDPDGSASIVYQLEWSTDANFVAGVQTRTSGTDNGFENTEDAGDGSPFTEGQTVRFTVPDPLSDSAADAAYFWRVRAKDDVSEGGSGFYGEWSTVRSFRINTALDHARWVQTADGQFGADALSATRTNGSGGVAIAPAMVRSVEYVEIALGVGTTSASATLTKGQNTAYCVPFASQMLTGMNNDFDDIFTDIAFETAPARVTATRRESGGSVTVGITVVEFEPTAVKVQQGAMNIAGTSGTSSITAVDQGKAALVFYYKSPASADDYNDAMVAGWFSANNTLSWQRDVSDRNIEGHYYVFEALGTQFTVQAASFSIGSGLTDGTAALTSVATNKTFLIASYRSSCSASYDYPYYVHPEVYLESPTQIRARRYNTGYTISDIRVFAVTFNDGGSVQRGSWSYGTSDTYKQATLSNTVNTNAAMAWAITLPPGAMPLNTYDTTLIERGYQKIKLTDGATVRADRAETGTAARGQWEVIEWPFQSTGTAVSTPVIFDQVPGMALWDALTFTDDEGDGDILYDIQYWDGDSWENTALTNRNSSPVDLSGLDPDNTHTQLRVRANFSTSGNSPVLEDWTVNWARPTLSIGDAEVIEGASGPTGAVFTVTLSKAIAFDVGFDYATSNGTAKAEGDYAGAGGWLTIPAGQTSTSITVTVNGDLLGEGASENFFVNLGNPSNATIAVSQGEGTITDDDTPPEIRIDHVNVIEGAAGTSTNARFTVSLNVVGGLDVKFSYTTSNGTATVSGNDYAATNGTLTIPAGQTSTSITVTVNGDLLDEGDSENFFVNLSNPSNATIEVGQGEGTITDDDATPSLDIGNAMVIEGAGGTSTNARFTVSLSAASGLNVSFRYDTSNGTAQAGSDYDLGGATLTIPAGTMSTTVMVVVHGDLLDEDDSENFFVNLGSLDNAVSGDGQGEGTITDDDATPSLSIGDAMVIEGAGGASTNARFTVSLSAASGLNVSFRYDTSNGTAQAGSDYVLGGDTLTISAGATNTTVTVVVNGDSIHESASENFFVNLSSLTHAVPGDVQGEGIVTDDDAAPVVSLNEATFDNAEIADATPDFEFMGTDADGDKVVYQVEWSTDVGFVSDVTTRTSGVDAGFSNRVNGAEISPFTPNQTVRFTVQDPLSDSAANAAYFWRVRARESNSALYGEWSSVRSFRVNTALDHARWVQTADGQFAADALSATRTNGSGGVVIAPAMVRSVEYVEIALGVGTTSASAILTKGQNTATCVPFASQMITGMNNDFDDIFTDIAFETGPARVTATRRESQGSVTVGITVVEFEPTAVKVQQGAMNIAGTSGTSSIAAVDQGKAALVFYYKSSASADDYNDAMVAGWFSANNTLSWQRDVSDRNIEGHYYVFEALGDQFTVQAASFSIGSGLTEGTAALTSVATNKTFLIASYRSSCSASYDYPYYVHPEVYLESPTQVRARRYSTGYTISDIRVFAVTFNDGGSVQRGGWSYGTSDTYKQATLSNTVNTNAAMAWAITLPPGAMPLNTYDTTLIERGYQKVKLTDGATVRADRAEIGTAARGQWEVIEWPFQSTGTAVSTPVIYDRVTGMASWDSLVFSNDVSHGVILYDIQYWDGDSWENTALTNCNSSPVDLSGLDPDNTHTQLRVRANFNAFGNSPVLEDWTVIWARPTLSIGDAEVIEGASGPTGAVFTVTLSKAIAFDVGFDYATSNGTAKAEGDYAAAGGWLTIPAGQTSTSITVTVHGDTVYEGDSQNFFVNLGNPSNATIAVSQGEGTITDDDEAPEMFIGDATVIEGAGGTTTNAQFSVTLSKVVDVDVSVGFAASNGTAVAVSDFVATNGTLTIPSGQMSGTVTVVVQGDALYENGAETFYVVLDQAVFATLTDGLGEGTITDDDSMPTLWVNDVTVTEGLSGVTNALFNVSLSAVSGLPASFRFVNEDGTATVSDNDYAATNGVQTIPAGQTNAAVTVQVYGDERYEGDAEHFFVNLSDLGNTAPGDVRGQGTITDDEALPSLTIGDVTVTEGNQGTTSAIFRVTLSPVSAFDSDFHFGTSNGTATVADGDYDESSGDGLIAMGQTNTTITVAVHGDTIYEGVSEAFFVNLSESSAHLAIVRGTGQCTINNDDSAPVLSIGDGTVTEGDAGTTSVTFTVSMNQDCILPVTVSFASSNGTALAGQDYVATNGTLTIPPGVTNVPVTVVVIGDETYEGVSEIVHVALSNPGDATLGDALGDGILMNDDYPETFTIQENFEDGFGVWTNTGGDTYEWTRWSGNTPTRDTGGNTGPTSGNTVEDSAGWYLYMETSVGYCYYAGDKVYLESPLLDADVYDTGLSFYYHLCGDSMGTLYVDVCNNGTWNNDVWHLTGPQQAQGTNAFIKVTLDLGAFAGKIKIRFRGVAAGYFLGDMAIDDLVITGQARNSRPLAPTLHHVPFDNEETPDATPSFEFTADDPDGTAGMVYEIQWSTDKTFASGVQTRVSDVDAGFENTVSGGDQSPFMEGQRVRFTMPDALANSADDSAYYWRVKARDAAAEGGSGYYGAWTAVSSLRVNTALPRSRWVQTAGPQFETGSLRDVEIYGAGQVRLAGTEAGLVESLTTGDDMQGNANYWYAQVFQHPTEFTISKIRVKMIRGGTGTHHFYLRQTTGSPAVPMTGSGANLRTATRVYTSNDPTTEAWYEYVFTSPYTIPANTPYAIVHEKNDFVQWRRQQYIPPGYPNGHYGYNYDDTATWSYRIERDFLFEIWGYGTATTGRLASSAIDLDWMPQSLWGRLSFTDDETQGDIKYDVQYWDGSAWQFTTVTNVDASSVSLSGLNRQTHGRIRLRAVIEGNLGATPYLKDWAVTWTNEPQVSISDVSIREGNKRTTNAVFMVTLSSPLDREVTLNYATSNGTAVVDLDYLGTNGTLRFPAGQTGATVTVSVKGEVLYESNEQFYINLSSPTNAAFLKGQGTGTILNDDRRLSGTMFGIR